MKSNAIVDDINAKMRYWHVNLCEELSPLHDRRRAWELRFGHSLTSRLPIKDMNVIGKRESQRRPCVRERRLSGQKRSLGDLGKPPVCGRSR